jgi:hypothetical protein
MASKKQCRLAQNRVRPALQFIPPPESPIEVVKFLQHAACMGFADPKLVAHLTEMGALFPKELAGAFRAFRKMQTSDN